MPELGGVDGEDDLGHYLSVIADKTGSLVAASGQLALQDVARDQALKLADQAPAELQDGVALRLVWASIWPASDHHDIILCANQAQLQNKVQCRSINSV